MTRTGPRIVELCSVLEKVKFLGHEVILTETGGGVHLTVQCLRILKPNFPSAVKQPILVLVPFSPLSPCVWYKQGWSVLNLQTNQIWERSDGHQSLRGQENSGANKYTMSGGKNWHKVHFIRCEWVPGFSGSSATAAETYWPSPYYTHL